MSPCGRSPRSQVGVVLLEVLAAILIFSIGILAVIGMQASSIANVADAKYRIDAAAVADRMLGVMWANQAALSADSGLVGELPNGTFATTVTPVTDGSEVTVTITWRPPNVASPHTFSTMARIYR